MKNIKIEKIKVYDSNITESGLMGIFDIISGEHEEIIIGDYTLINLEMGNYAKIFDSLELLKEEKLLFEKYFESTKQSTELQIPQMCGWFELNNKYYLIFFATMNMLGATTQKKYKGMIIDILDFEETSLGIKKLKKGDKYNEMEFIGNYLKYFVFADKEMFYIYNEEEVLISSKKIQAYMGGSVSLEDHQVSVTQSYPEKEVDLYSINEDGSITYVRSYDF